MSLLKKADAGATLPLAAAAAADLTAAHASLAQLHADLAIARDTAAEAEARHQAALATFAPDAQLIAQSHELGIGPLARTAHDVQTARKTITAIEMEIARIESELRADEEAATRARREQLAAELWPRSVKAVAAATRGLIAALEQQQRIVAQLEAAGALGLIDTPPLVLPDALPWDDPAGPVLRAWLAAAKRAGYDK